MPSFLPISDQRLQEIKSETDKDKTLQILKSAILQGWPAERKDAPVQVTPYFSVRDELSVQDRLLFRGERVVVLQALRQDIKQRIQSSHMGAESCLRRAREFVFQPKMNAKCKTCRKFEASQPKEPLMTVEMPSRPREKSESISSPLTTKISSLQSPTSVTTKQHPGQYSGPHRTRDITLDLFYGKTRTKLYSLSVPIVFAHPHPRANLLRSLI